jgi:uncharacterized Zn-finger protein
LLDVHTRRHLGIKPLKCDSCPRRFTNSADLKRHLKVHTKYRPFACVSCSGRFSSKRYLRKHMVDCHPELKVEFTPARRVYKTRVKPVSVQE